MPAWTLHHCPRSGKSDVMVTFAFGREPRPMRQHQAEALEFLGGRPDEKTASGHALFVFGSLVVLRDFELEFIQEDSSRASGHRGYAADRRYLRITGDKAPSRQELATLLLDGRPIVICTTYQSSWKVDEALREARKRRKSTRFATACFDEAHNVHTPERQHLWRDVAWLESAYPRRLYATGTPRREMEIHPRVYGDTSRQWHRVSYERLLAEQDPAAPIVKSFKVTVSLQRDAGDEGDNGVEEVAQHRQGREFLDWVSILRQAHLDGARRVKIYNKRARDDPRGASDFAETWRSAHEYLEKRQEWPAWKSLEVKSADGEMTFQTLNDIKSWFNEAAVDGGAVRILCSCQVFGEGVSFESVDLTVFADRKRSTRDVVQSGMRGLRASSLGPPGAYLRILLLAYLKKTHDESTQLDALDLASQIDTSLKNDGRQNLTEILSALRRIDGSFMCENPVSVHRDQRGQRGQQQQMQQRLSVRLEREVIEKLELDGRTADEASAIVSSSLLTYSGVDHARELVQWKVRKLCEFKTRQVPSRRTFPASAEDEFIPRALRERDCEGDVRVVNFLGSIRNNWPWHDGSRRKANTTLRDEDMRAIERLPWFDAWIGGDYGMVKWKVRVLAALWPGDQVPRTGVSREVGKDLLAVAPLIRGYTEERLMKFNGRRFLDDIRGTWHAGKAKTILQERERRVVERLSWFRRWCLEPYEIVRWKVRVLRRLWRGGDVPSKVRRVPAALLEAAPRPQEMNFDAARFLERIAGNFQKGVESSTTPFVLLRDEESDSIRRLPWFEKWRRSLRKAAKHRDRPSTASKSSTPSTPSKPSNPSKPSTHATPSTKRRRSFDFDDDKCEISLDVPAPPSARRRRLREKTRPSSNGLKNAARGYDASHFTPEHQDFKDACSKVFAKLVVANTSNEDSVVVLDDVDGRAQDRLRSCSDLIDVGVRADRIYSPNQRERVRELAERLGVHGSHESLYDFLKRRSNTESSLTSQTKIAAVYMDFCGGERDNVLGHFNLVRGVANVVAYTMSARSTGETITSRLMAIGHHFQNCGYKQAYYREHGGIYTVMYVHFFGKLHAAPPH